MSIIDILGEKYEIISGFESKEFDGEAKFYSKQINLKYPEDMLDSSSTNAEKMKRWKEVFRHELLHCFLYQSGHSDYAEDEKLIDALSILSPEIFKTFNRLNLL